MINKLYTERGLLYGASMHCIFKFQISGNPQLEHLKKSIYFAMNRFEILRCRIMQDSVGDSYYVLREKECEPFIEVRDYHMTEQEFIKEQERKIFRFDKGELIRFYIESLNDEVILRIVAHHLAGDGESIFVLMREIMQNLNKMGKDEVLLELKPIIPLRTYLKDELEEKIQLNDLLRFSMEEFNTKWKKEKKIYTYNDYQKMFEKFWDSYGTNVKCLKVKKNTLREASIVCRKYGVSINSFILTAAVKELIDTKRIGVIVSARPDDYEGMGNYAGNLIIDGTYDKGKDFWENAQYIHNQIHSKLGERITALFPLVFRGVLDVNFLDAINFVGMEGYESKLANEFNDMYGTGIRELPLSISNMGMVHLTDEESQYKVIDASVASPLVPGVNCTMGIVTVNGIMNIIMQYNEGKADDYVVMLEGVQKCLEEITPDNIQDEVEKTILI